MRSQYGAFPRRRPARPPLQKAAWRAAWPAASLALAAAAALGPAPAAAATVCPAPVVFTVLNTGDSGAGSLRQAILDADAAPNAPAGCPADAIEFNIPGAGPFVITLASDLPEITDPVNVRGYQQPGAVPATAVAPATIQIWIDATDAANGLVVRTDDSSISGLVIGNAGSGVAALPAGDGDGIKVTGDRNRVRGNYIGTHQAMAAPPSFLNGTAGDGIEVTGDGNEVGSGAVQDRNVVAASGPLFGDASGTAGVKVAGDGNAVQGNVLGTDPGVTTGQIGNRGGGVHVMRGEGNRIGGSAAGTGNLISGNAGPAILLHGSTVFHGPATRTAILGNTIGTGILGTEDFGNSHGVVVEAGSTQNVIGGPGDGDGNLIVNTLPGPGIELAGDANLVLHNTIGVNAAQTAALANFGGVSVSGNLNVIGGDAANAGNVVSGNSLYGISLADSGDPRKAVGNLVWGNHIGTDATDARDLGNEGDGVQILGGDAAQVGGSGGAGFRPNVIANNHGAGVGVATGVLNAVRQNSIHDNGGLGIDLQRDGAVLANDAGDGDAGPNGLQNHPIVTGVTTVAGVTSVGWDASSFRTDPAGTETTELDFYSSDSCDPSGNGEGRTLIGSVLIGVGALPGTGSTAVTRRVARGQYVTATATSGAGVPRLPGRTSEFSPCFQVP
ncbi:hypothetical protein [Nonomuraea sp. NPDC050783]|uniref:hypothetical protein n=1 Tax=Nonomuraea sp. NPDC050783 TaxID=3154634 RepID=UPI003465E60B